MGDNIEYSVVIPIYNEEENIMELYNRLTKVMVGLTKSYEIIFVDDGSQDKSYEIMKTLHQRDDQVKALKFTRNFGHHIAITAGLEYAQGDMVVLMDGDLQDPPEEIPSLYKKFKGGYDIVYAVRKIRKDPIFKKVASKLFYRIFKTLVQIEIFPESGIFRIMSRRAVSNLISCREKSRFITALMSWTGFSHAGVEIEREVRRTGKTKYNLFKLIQLAVDGITSFSYFPLRIAIYIGFFMALFSFTMGMCMLIKKIFFGIPILGYASIIISVLFIGGVQLLIIGVIGEYIGRIYTEVQNRPAYIVEEKLGIK